MQQQQPVPQKKATIPHKIFLASQGNYDLFYESTNGRLNILYISTTQEILEEKYESMCNKIFTQESDQKKIAFLNVGNLHYAVVATGSFGDSGDNISRAEEQIESYAALKRQLYLFHDLLRFRIKISLNSAPMNIALSQGDTRRLVRVRIP